MARPHLGTSLLSVGVALCACGEEAPPIATVRLALGVVPARVVSVSVAVFDEDGLAVSSTVAPARSDLDVGVPAEVPLLFQVVARTATPAPAVFGGSMPAFVARAERTIPLSREQVLVSLEARRAGGLILNVVSDDLVSGALVVRSDEGVLGVRYPWAPSSLRASAIAVLGRGRQQVSFEPEDQSGPVFVGGGADLWVSEETLSVADVRLGARPVARSLDAVFTDAARVPLGPTASAPAGVRLELGLRIEGEAVDQSDARVTLTAVGTGSARLEGLPSLVEGLPRVIEGLTATGEGRISLRAELDEGVGTVVPLNVGPPPGAAAGLQLVVPELRRLADGTFLEIWVVDALGRLSPPPAGRLTLADSDPWLVQPLGTTFPVEATPASARLRRPIALTSRPLEGTVVVRAALLTDTGTLTATLGLRGP